MLRGCWTALTQTTSSTDPRSPGILTLTLMMKGELHSQWLSSGGFPGAPMAPLSSPEL